MPSSDETSARLQRLEETVAFQQRTLDHFNEVVVAMQLQVDRLQHKLNEQKSKLQWLSENASVDDVPNEKPPHY